MQVLSFLFMFFLAWRSRQPGLMSSCLANLTPNEHNGEANENLSPERLPLLPAASDSKEGYRTLKLGETLPMDELGPIIINPDGTSRRITNWDNLSKQEQLNTWRIISGRNKKRIEALRRQSDSASTPTPPADEVIEQESDKTEE